MIKLTLEGDGAEIVHILEALRAAGGGGAVVVKMPAGEFTPAASMPSSPASAPPSPAPWATPENNPLSHLPPPTPEQVREGCNAWLGLTSEWARGFGDEAVDQPDRAKLIVRTMEAHSRDLFAFLRHCQGLTALVRTVHPKWSKKEARLIAENIASVTSAVGIPVIADYLEYTTEYSRENLK